MGRMVMSLILLAVLTVFLIASMGNMESEPVTSSTLLVASRVVSLEKNLANIQEFECGTPRAELYYIGEEEDDADRFNHVIKSIEFRPRALVVHRCSRRTGACNVGNTCTAATEEEVVFVVEKMMSGLSNSMDSASSSEISITVMNHTSCICTSSPTTSSLP